VRDRTSKVDHPFRVGFRFVTGSPRVAARKPKGGLVDQGHKSDHLVGGSVLYIGTLVFLPIYKTSWHLGSVKVVLRLEGAPGSKSVDD
jgi:hypothetical protein